MTCRFQAATMEAELDMSVKDYRLIQTNHEFLLQPSKTLMDTTWGKFVSSRVMEISEIRKQLCLFIEVLMFGDFGFLFNPVVVFPAAASASSSTFIVVE